ncbi:MAG: acyl-CoA dehydrogenase [Actinobacteria bacterium]|nr:MAG: acyl-CoA dehydrogenase [Actinomycetota bacterium]
MDFEFTDEQLELREQARNFLEKECPISLVRAVVEDGTDAGALWESMVRLDWPALTVPEDSGGLGLGYVELAVVLEELGRVIAPGPFLATVSQFIPAVREAATDAQRSRWLGAIARGEITGTLAVAEESGVWTPAAVECVARRDGDDWVLDGTKDYVLEGAAADELVVAARLPGTRDRDGMVLAVVPQAAVETTVLPTIDASRHHARVALSDVRISADRILGNPGEAGAALARALEEAITALAVEMLGTCQAIFDMTLEYAKVREQFGVPIGSFQAVKHKLANMFVALERARAVCYFAALTIAEDDDRRTLGTSMAKAAVGECQQLVVQDGLQLHGGIGYTWEHDLHLYLKRAKSGDAQLGTAADHRARVAELIGLGAA